jgi:hypothetical protein
MSIPQDLEKEKGKVGRLLRKRNLSVHNVFLTIKSLPSRMFPTFQMLLCMLSSFVLCVGYDYLLLVACMPAFVPQNGRRLTHSNFLTHLAWIVQPHEYLKKSVDLDNSDFKLPRDLEE